MTERSARNRGVCLGEVSVTAEVRLYICGRGAMTTCPLIHEVSVSGVSTDILLSLSSLTIQI